MKIKLQVVSIILRIILGIFFIVLAINKLFNMNNFQEVILKYNILPISIVPIFSLIIIFLEYALGILLILGLFTRWAVSGLLFLMFVFVFAIIINIFRGNFVDCGCYGNLLVEKIGWQVLLRDFSISGILLLIGIQNDIKFLPKFKGRRIDENTNQL